jgi:4,5-DOPA dioxygenase extradiol
MKLMLTIIFLIISYFLIKMDTKQRMPTVFLAHGGGPLPLLNDKSHKEMVNKSKELAKLIPKPKAILIISAHWEEKEFTILETTNPDLLFDYYGFPDESYSYKYPAPLAKDVNSKLKEIFSKAGVKLNSETNRGFDHGVFVPLLLMYPNADIPISQISLKSSLDAETHFKMGNLISSIRDDGVLIFASGMSFHNMSGFFNPSKEIKDGNIKFHEYLKDSLTNKDLDQAKREKNLINWKNSPNNSGKLCHPREEHLIPMYVAAGAASGKIPNLQEFELMGYQIFNALFE